MHCSVVENSVTLFVSVFAQSLCFTMNGHVEDVKQYEARPAGSPVRVKADPDLVSDVTISCSTPTSQEYSERKHNEEPIDWDSAVADLPSEDEDG